MTLNQYIIYAPKFIKRYNENGFELLIKRMMERRLHIECLKLCEYMKCSTLPILHDWAETLVK